MIPRSLARQIRFIEIITTKAVNDFLAGEYHSVFKGQGIEFEEVREYQPGDDVRSIDWNVTARMGHPFIKRFVEERELTVMLLLDLSASGAFGSRHKLKNELAAELCAVLAFSAIKNQDKVGLIAFTDKVELVVPPAKGASHALSLIRDVLQFRPQGKRTRLAAGIEYLRRVTTRRCVVFLISDFWDADFAKPLRAASRQHDLIAISVTDARERALPNAGLIDLEDAETGELVQLDASSLEVRQQFEQFAQTRRESLQGILRSAGVDEVEVSSTRDYVRDLTTFFRKRERRGRY